MERVTLGMYDARLKPRAAVQHGRILLEDRLTHPADRFEAMAMPHLPAAYNLARWLLRDDQSADDVVQEAFLRAFRFFHDLRGEDARPWLLGIVRNACFDWMRQHRYQDSQVAFDEFDESGAGAANIAGPADPAALYARHTQRQRVNAAIAALAPAFREMIVLRELEEMSYEEVARVVGVPVGTVMSRLSRARAMLRQRLQGEMASPPAAGSPASAPVKERNGHD